MKIKDFPNPQLLLEIFKDQSTAEMDVFSHVNIYLESIAPFIYTEIALDYIRQDERHLHGWVQKFVSENILRSIYLRNAFVDAFNAGNLTGIYPPLKAWMEIVATLIYILDALKQGLSNEELYERFQWLPTGNRGEGSFRVGDVDAVGVTTLIKKADKFFAKIAGEYKRGAEHNLGSIFTDYYDVASNPSHPTYDAHAIVGEIMDDGAWHARTPQEVASLLIEQLPLYGGLLLMPIFTYRVTKEIFEIEDIYFKKIASKPFFD